MAPNVWPREDPSRDEYRAAASRTTEPEVTVVFHIDRLTTRSSGPCARVAHTAAAERLGR